MTSEPGADDRFVTVSQAVSLLGVSERTARRYAGQVPDGDRQTPDKGPARYRLSSLRKIAGSAEVPEAVPDSDRPSVAQTPVNAGHVPDALIEAMRRAAVAEARADLLESERDNLREALQREQETARRAMDAQNALAAELAKAREQSAVLIAATAGAFDAQRIAPSAPESPDTVQGGVSTPPGSIEGQGTATDDGGHVPERPKGNPIAGWWRRVADRSRAGGAP